MVKDKFEQEEEDEDLCACCLDGTVYDDNEILLCDKCDVPVHQSCYGIKTVPDDDWFCNVCRAGLNPNNVKCELCSFTGGAYKPTACGKWVHVLCASWIPEIFCRNTDLMEPFDISGVDKRRFTLKCTVCKTKGAVVQCSYGRCSTGAHPRCALTDLTSGYTHRIIKNSSGGSDWEIFCKQHAGAVKEAAKPKRNWGGGFPYPKKSGTKAGGVDDDEVVDNEQSNQSNKKGSFKKKAAIKSKQNDSDSEFNESDARRDSDDDFEGEAPSKGRGRPRGSTKDKGDYALAADAIFDQEYWCKLYSETQLDLDEKDGKESDIKQKIFKVLTLSEWPGQNEGEAMDLMHFWSFISMGFPEDHAKEWVEYMCSTMRRIDGTSPEMFVPPVPSDEDDADNKLLVKTDNILASYSERDRNGIFDSDIRDNFLSLLKAYSEQLKPIVDGNEILERSLLEDKIQREQRLERERKEIEEAALMKSDMEIAEHDDSSGKPRKDKKGRSKVKSAGSRDSLSSRRESRDSLSTMVPAALAYKQSQEDEVETETIAARVFAHDENPTGSLYTSAKSYLTKEVYEAEGTASSSEVKVLFDGPNRQSCTFKIDFSDKPNEDGWASVSLDSVSTKDNKEWVNSHLLGSSSSSSSLAPSLQNALIKLDNHENFPRDVEVELGNQRLIARSDDDIVRRILMTDQQVYKELMNSVKDRMDSLLRTTIYERVAHREADRIRWQEIEDAYVKQRVWCKIGLSINQGMKDQQNDFNVHAPEEVPASWTIQVDGRPTAPTVPEDAADSDDAVCMVCFDGSSCDANSILFCDGCNASLHQTCYGITEVPEGDFFCDRCQAVQWFASECDDWYYHFSKDAVTCALCPLYHGGLKPTTDGRWVHLCCAVWSQSAVKNLDEMMPVDITNVENPPLGSICLYCQQSSGHLVSCCGSEEDGCDCKIMFHPLCAWFNGNYLETTVTDPAFKNYPDGLSFKFFCHKHCPSESAGEDIRNLQVKLRTKYKILEEDLEGIPGKNKKKRKNKKKERSVAIGRGGTANTKKDLRDKPNPDVCAICLTSTQNNHLDVVELTDDAARTCVSCQYTIHASCDPHPYEAGLVVVEGEVAPDAIAAKEEDGTIKVWKCAMCITDTADPNCVACTRKGGYFRPTVDGQWIHAFCAKHCPGNMSITDDNEVHIKAIPKTMRRKNCIVCNRGGQRGFVVACQVEGCPNLFHPLCAERNHAGFLRVRNGVKTAYCSEHIPPEAKRLPSGGWLDVNEVQMLRFTVDKARLILDVVRKREKTRKVIWNTEGELFTCKLNRLLKAYRSKKLGEVTTLAVGMTVAGPGVAPGTTIVSMEEGNKYLLSNPLEAGIPEDAMEIVSPKVEEVKEGHYIEEEVKEGHEIKEEVKEGHEIKEEGSEKERSCTPVKTEQSPIKTSTIGVGAIVRSMYGVGIIKSIRSDGMSIIEASNWLLANNKPPTFYMMNDTLILADTTTPRKSRENATITAVGENGIELLVNGSIEGTIMTVTAVHMKDTVEDILMDTNVFRDAEDEKMFENFFVNQEAQSKSKKKEKSKKQRVSTGKVGWENFTELPCGEIVPISTRRYDSIEISSTWLDAAKKKVEIPDRIMVNLAGLELVQSDATMCSRPKEYLENVKERIARQMENTGGYPSEDSVFKVKPEKFQKDLEKETKKIIGMNDKDFKMWKMNTLDPIMSMYVVPDENKKKRKTTRDGMVTAPESPSRLDPSSMTEADLFNYTFSTLDNANNTGFDMELETAELSVLAGDWGWANTEELKMRVERIIQDVLSVLENFRCSRSFDKEPIIPKDGNIFTDRMSSGMQGKLLKTQRVLAGDFKDIPYDQIPNYDTLVKTPLSLTILGERLARRSYHSLNVFSTDFYEMLNNGRSLSPEGSQVHSDTHYIALLFEKAKEDAKNLTPDIPITQSGFQSVQRLMDQVKDTNEGENSHSASSMPADAPCAPIRCGCCLLKYSVACWPKLAYFPSHGACSLAEPQIEPLSVGEYMEATMEEGAMEALPSKDEEKVYSSYVRTVDSARKHPLQWLCRECITARATSTIIGKVVKIWWHDDMEWYSGIVDTYEASSGRHRIKYFDGMWEFVDLRAEPYLITYPRLKKADEIIEDPEEPIYAPPTKRGRKSNDFDNATSTPRARPPSNKLAENIEIGMYDGKSPNTGGGMIKKKGKPGRPRKRPLEEEMEENEEKQGEEDHVNEANELDGAVEYMGKIVHEMSANELKDHLNNLDVTTNGLNKAEKVSTLENIARIDMDTIYSLSYEGEIIDEMNLSMLKNFMLVLHIKGRMNKDDMQAQLVSIATDEIHGIQYKGKSLVKYSKDDLKKIFTELNLPKLNDKKDDLMLALGEYLKRVAVFAR